ncbi:MAG TPA: hypothetical protein VFB43_16800 [Terracidiphilus sp.]|jgi:hypothetical protein|nr:hypothetical protein [Terracidiphilus sp.]
MRPISRRPFSPQGTTSTRTLARSTGPASTVSLWGCLCGLAVVVLLTPAPASSQVLTIDTSGKGPVAATGPVDRRYQQITPTNVTLTKTELDTKTRLELERVLESEQGFAMRPFPRGHKGLILQANGKLEPAGEAYLNMVVSDGLCAKPGDRLVITDVKFEKSRIIFALNGGPDFKHRFLRHIQLGTDPNYSNSVVPDEPDPTGARLTLTFKDHVPAMTGADVKALLAPLISFDVKTPIQAFTDTLPPALKDAILKHQVWVGMSTDMVLFAKGEPQKKVREMEGQMPFEEWIYGQPPQDVDFVRINGNRVIRVEIAKVGEPLQVFTDDKVEGLMRSDGTPVMAANTRTIHEGDVEKDPNKQAPDAPPSLRNPGEGLPDDQNKSVGVMRPVQMPKPHPVEMPGQNPDDQPPAASSPTDTSQQQSAPVSAPADSQSAPSGGKSTAQQQLTASGRPGAEL